MFNWKVGRTITEIIENKINYSGGFFSNINIVWHKTKPFIDNEKGRQYENKEGRKS